MILNNMSENEQIKAVSIDPYNIRYIDNPSERVQLVAVKKFATAIQYINNPIEKVQLTAINETILSIYYIKNPCRNVLIAALLRLIFVYENRYSYSFYINDLLRKYSNKNYPELIAIRNHVENDK